MRTKRLARIATFLVVILISMSACLNEQIIGPTGPTINFYPIVPKVDTAGTCITTRTIYASNQTWIMGDSIVFPTVSQGDTLMMRVTSVPQGCAPRETFNWETSNSAVVSVVRLDSVSARITGVTPGRAIVTAVSEQVSTRRFPIVVRVSGDTTTPTVSTIDYAPIMATMAVGDTLFLDAKVVHGTDIPASEPANPSWYSTNPGAWEVLAIGTSPPSGSSNMRARLVKRALGSADVCIVWSSRRANPKGCHTWP